MSRSRLVSPALRDFLRRRRQEETAERLNQAYGAPDVVETYSVKRMEVKFSRVIQDRW